MNHLVALCLVAVFLAASAQDRTSTSTTSGSTTSSSTTSASNPPRFPTRHVRQAAADNYDNTGVGQQGDDSSSSDSEYYADGSQQQQQQQDYYQSPARTQRQAARTGGGGGRQQQQVVAVDDAFLPQQDTTLDEVTPRRARQAARTTPFATTEDDFAQGTSQDEPQARGHNTQFAGPRRPAPAPRPGSSVSPGFRPQPPAPRPQQGGGGSSGTLTLPDGVDLIIGQVQPGFSCDQKIYGYYADTFNDCRLFHVCVPVADENGPTGNTLQWSFVCGNTTRFNQELLICDHEDNVDCTKAEGFYNINENFGRPEDKVAQPTGFRPTPTRRQ